MTFNHIITINQNEDEQIDTLIKEQSHKQQITQELSIFGLYKDIANLVYQYCTYTTAKVINHVKCSVFLKFIDDRLYYEEHINPKNSILWYVNEFDEFVKLKPTNLQLGSYRYISKFKYEGKLYIEVDTGILSLEFDKLTYKLQHTNIRRIKSRDNKLIYRTHYTKDFAFKYANSTSGHMTPKYVKISELMLYNKKPLNPMTHFKVVDNHTNYIINNIDQIVDVEHINNKHVYKFVNNDKLYEYRANRCVLCNANKCDSYIFNGVSNSMIEIYEVDYKISHIYVKLDNNYIKIECKSRIFKIDRISDDLLLIELRRDTSTSQYLFVKLR